MSKKLIVIVGPNASGKSDLAINIAKEFNGEIISADSRQVYRGMDLGTGKVPRDKPKTKNQKDYFYKGVKHHLLDIASPKRRFTVAQYQKRAIKAINEIHKKNKLPVVCGGSGFYIQAVVDGITIPPVPPDWQLRKKLEKKSPDQLYQVLKKLNPYRARIIDKKNPRRLIRAIEIAIKTKKTIPPLKKSPLPYPFLIIGIKKEKEELKLLIKKRLLKRLRQGMIDEVNNLKKSGVSWKRLEEFGLEYRYIARYLQNKINYSEMIQALQKKIENYAKRQMTWFKKDKRINWARNQKKAKELINIFLKKGGSKRNPFHPVSEVGKQRRARNNLLNQQTCLFQRFSGQNDREKHIEAIRARLLNPHQLPRLII